MKTHAISLGLLTTLISACVQPIYGVTKNYNDVLYGTITGNPITGRAYVDVQSLVSKARCAGTAIVDYFIEAESATGGMNGGVLTCQNGTIVNLTFSHTKNGHMGIGKDQYGNEYVLKFGMSETEAAEKVTESLKKSQQLAGPKAK